MRQTSRQKCERLLTAEGKEKYGHIFPHGRVPLTQQTPISAIRQGGDGEPELVFCVDWERLTELQQPLVLCYIADSFDVSVDEVRENIESLGFFPIQAKYVVESYDMRYLM